MAKKNKNKRIEYGFELVFPTTFTLRDLYEAKQHKVKYITLYSRVKKAVDNGDVVEAGLREPENTRRGRWETVYRVTKTPEADPITTAEVAVPTATNW